MEKSTGMSQDAKEVLSKSKEEFTSFCKKQERTFDIDELFGKIEHHINSSNLLLETKGMDKIENLFDLWNDHNEEMLRNEEDDNGHERLKIGEYAGVRKVEINRTNRESYADESFYNDKDNVTILTQDGKKAMLCQISVE